MTFYKATFAWLIIGAFLGWGVYMTAHPTKPSFVPLAIALVCVVGAIGKFGCLPPSDEHH